MILMGLFRLEIFCAFMIPVEGKHLQPGVEAVWGLGFGSFWKRISKSVRSYRAVYAYLEYSPT